MSVTQKWHIWKRKEEKLIFHLQMILFYLFIYKYKTSWRHTTSQDQKNRFSFYQIHCEHIYLYFLASFVPKKKKKVNHVIHQTGGVKRRDKFCVYYNAEFLPHFFFLYLFYNFGLLLSWQKHISFQFPREFWKCIKIIADRNSLICGVWGRYKNTTSRPFCCTYI